MSQHDKLLMFIKFTDNNSQPNVIHLIIKKPRQMEQAYTIKCQCYYTHIITTGYEQKSNA